MMRYLVVGVCGNVAVVEPFLDIILATDDIAIADKAIADNYQLCVAGQIICIDTVTGINLSSQTPNA